MKHSFQNRGKGFRLSLLLTVTLLLSAVFARAEDKTWHLVTDAGQAIEMSRVCSLVATDTEDTFSVLDASGNVLAKGVSKATFQMMEPTGIAEPPIQGNILESLVDNVLTLIGAEGDIEIFNGNGSKMLGVKATARETRINVSQFAPGVYLLKCGKQTFKFTKK